MNYSALIPVKTLAHAKSRLVTHLSARERETLVLDMLQHVLQTLDDCAIFAQIYVVSADMRVLELAQQWGAEGLREGQAGHNPALRAAALTILARAAWREGLYSTWLTLSDLVDVQQEPALSVLRTLPDEALLTIAADLPLLTSADVRQFVAQAERYQVALAGSTDGTGTNALLVRPPLALPYLFGPHSLSAYTQAAHARHLSCTLYQNARLAFDVDTPGDVRQLEQLARSWSLRTVV